VIISSYPMINFPAVSWREQVTF